MKFTPHVVATAGHIDHGKSTLVEALTGTDPDRLPEEKRRGMTIELGYAPLDLPDGRAEGGLFRIGLVDVPGHADFVRNMVAGVGCVDAALLIVAADDGWMPQTEEHFQIILHLGIGKGVVAVTKADLLADPDAFRQSLTVRLAGTPWSAARIVPVCALTGDGLPELRAALADALAELPQAEEIGLPRLFVDRVFSPRGVGTVVTGTLTGGALEIGQEIAIPPKHLAGKIRGLQNHGQPVTRARPGTRTAVQLGGIDVATDGGIDGVWRGDVLTAGSGTDASASGAGAEMGQRSGAAGRRDASPASGRSCLALMLHRLDRPPLPGLDPPASIRHGQKVWLHHGTAALEGRVYFAGPKRLGLGESTLGEVRLSRPVFALAGDRVVLRDFSRQHTLAGGLILEAQSRPRSWKRPGGEKCLLAYASAPNDASVRLAATLERDGLVDPAAVFRLTRFSPAERTAAVAAQASVKPLAGWIATETHWRTLAEAAGQLIRDFHASQPAEASMKLARLRPWLARSLPDEALHEPFLDSLTATGFQRDAGGIRARDFRPAVAPEIAAAREKIRKSLTADPFNPPGLGTLAVNAPEKAALRLMIDEGEVFYLSEDVVMTRAAFIGAKARITAHLRQHQRATVAELRDLLGCARRIMVPLCEKLDRDRITIRQGDFRLLPPPRT